MIPCYECAGVSLAAIKTVIIDEVDTMLHKGFKQQVGYNVGQVIGQVSGQVRD